MAKHQTILAIVLVLAVLTMVVAIGQSISNVTPYGLVTLVDIDPNEIDDFFENGELKEEILEKINENIDEVPDFVLDMFSEGKTNVTLQTTDGEEKEFTVNVMDNKLSSANEGHALDADAEITVNEEMLEKIASSNEPLEDLVGAVNSGEIKYEALSAEAKSKELFFGIISFFLGIIMGIFSFFKSLFGG